MRSKTGRLIKFSFLFSLALSRLALWADPLNCDLSRYQEHPGLTATVSHDLLIVSWTGTNHDELSLRLGIQQGQPVIRELAVRKPATGWNMLGKDLVPEYRVTSGKRRMSEQQAAPLRELGVAITDEVVEKNQWYAFWDAPLEVPGTRPGEKTPVDIGLPRTAEEIHRATASFQTKSCRVETNGQQIGRAHV